MSFQSYPHIIEMKHVCYITFSSNKNQGNFKSSLVHNCSSWCQVAGRSKHLRTPPNLTYTHAQHILWHPLTIQPHINHRTVPKALMMYYSHQWPCWPPTPEKARSNPTSHHQEENLGNFLFHTPGWTPSGSPSSLPPSASEICHLSQRLLHWLPWCLHVQ